MKTCEKCNTSYHRYYVESDETYTEIPAVVYTSTGKWLCTRCGKEYPIDWQNIVNPEDHRSRKS